MMKRIGFTGTAEGLTEMQKGKLKKLLYDVYGPAELHHGDCVGADAQAAAIAWKEGLDIIVHPPDDPKLRAFKLPATEVRKEKPYLTRNRAIVKETQWLIACPHGMVEPPRGRRGEGTWWTVNYARDKHRRVVIVWPDGTVTREENQE
jgi:hypothetical protein